MWSQKTVELSDLASRSDSGAPTQRMAWPAAGLTIVCASAVLWLGLGAVAVLLMGAA